MFKETSLKKFHQRFQSEDDCKQYLYELKWKNGFQCSRCGNKTFWPGRTRFHSRCKACNYDESVTANTIFHKLQFALTKAFTIAFHLSVYNKGISSRSMAVIVKVNQKTAWLFMRKLQKAMSACILADKKKRSNVEHLRTDSVILSHRSEGINGLQRIGVAIHHRTEGRNKFARIACNGYVAFNELADPCNLLAGRYVDEGKNILLWNFKVWLTGMHHHCSLKYLNGYLSEFSFRFNFRGREKLAWHTLISWMMLRERTNGN